MATEEALAAVPGSMREGSYACGASKWQTIRRIVLPRAMPGILTGMILAMARGAGEVAPLMLVGAIKLAPELPVDGTFPFVHPQRSFMHLGFHIYDLGFQSQNSEAAKPMVFTTTLLLIVIVATLNVTAIWLALAFAAALHGQQVLRPCLSESLSLPSESKEPGIHHDKALDPISRQAWRFDSGPGSFAGEQPVERDPARRKSAHGHACSRGKGDARAGGGRLQPLVWHEAGPVRHCPRRFPRARSPR